MDLLSASIDERGDDALGASPESVRTALVLLDGAARTCQTIATRLEHALPGANGVCPPPPEDQATPGPRREST